MRIFRASIGFIGSCGLLPVVYHHVVMLIESVYEHTEALFSSSTQHLQCRSFKLSFLPWAVC